MDSYTKEQIEAAFDSATGDFSVNLKRDVIAQLEKPVWEPQVGEVVYNRITERYYTYAKYGAIGKAIRPMSESEVPALALAIERWEKVIGNIGFDEFTQIYAQQALTDIKALCGVDNE